MEERYAVFTLELHMRTIHAEGDADQVSKWLMERAGQRIDGYKVLDRVENKVMSDDYFMMTIAPYHQPKLLSEDAIRRIIREEMSNLLDAVGKKVGVPEYMEAEKMEDAFVSIIETAAEKSANTKVYDHEEYYHSQS